MNRTISRRSRIASLFVGLALAGFCLAQPGCNDRTKSGAPDKAAMNVAVPVHVASARRADVPIQVHAIGWVQAHASVTVKPQVEGQITEIHFVDGQDVQAGDLLFSIDKRPFVGALRRAEAELLKDKALAQDAEREARRVEDLFQRTMAADRERDQARADADAAAAQVQADDAAVDSAKLRVEYCSIRSAIAGRVGERLVDRGNIVKANEAELVTIHQLSPIYVTFSVAERHLSTIREQMKNGPLSVETRYPDDAGTPVTGVLTFVDNKVDSTTGMVRLKATFENKDHYLWPGRFAGVTLTTITQLDAVVVPSEAIQTGQKGQFVFVVRKDQTVELRPVEIGPIMDDFTVINSGVEAGEVVVTDGQLRLAPDAKIEIKSELASAGGARHANPAGDRS